MQIHTKTKETHHDEEKVAMHGHVEVGVQGGKELN